MLPSEWTELLVTIGLPPAGSRLSTEVQTKVCNLMEKTPDKHKSILLDILARCFAEEAAGEDIMENLPVTLPEDFLIQLIGGSYKKFPADAREERTLRVFRMAVEVLEQRLRFTRSLSPEVVIPLPSSNQVLVLNSTQVQVPNSNQVQVPNPNQDRVDRHVHPIVTATMVREEIARADRTREEKDREERVREEDKRKHDTEMLERVVQNSIERWANDAKVKKQADKQKRKAAKRCEQCGKSTAQCLCASLAMALPARGELDGNGGAGTVPSQPAFKTKTFERKGRSKGDPSGSSSSSSNSSESKSTAFSSNASHKTESLPVDPSFRNPTVLFLPKHWERAFSSGQTVEDLRRELLLQFEIQRLRREQPGSWTTDLGERLCEIVIMLALEGVSFDMISMHIEILFRLRLYAQGAPSDEIEMAMAKLRGFKLPKIFRSAATAIKHSTRPSTAKHTGGSAPKQPPAVAGRLPPSVWKAMSPAAKASHKAQYPRA